jgi:hypothetical protein
LFADDQQVFSHTSFSSAATANERLLVCINNVMPINGALSDDYS